MKEFQQIKKGRANTITVITPETIENIPKVSLFDNYELDVLLFNLHQELLRLSMKKNHSYEVGLFWNLINWDEVYKINGTENGVALSDNDDIRRWIKTAPMNSVVVMHNHPRNGLFSGADLKSFSTYQSIYAMTAVCNDGTIYMMKKTEKFDPVALMMYYSIGIKEGKEYSGIKNVAKNAHKIGIVYRCSVKRRKRYEE